MSLQISKRVHETKSSPTLSLAARANQLKAAGKPIINLTVGEPDFDTPEFIKTAAIQALADGFTKYTPVAGLLSLKEAILSKLERDNQLHYTPKQIIVTSGAKQAIYNLIQAIINPGDEVIIPAPYWVSYPDIVTLAGGHPIILPTDLQEAFKITEAQLSQAITPKTRLFILNSPSNPTGAVYTAKELIQLAQILLRHPQVIILTDDIYEHIYWGEEPFKNIVQTCPALSCRTIIVNGVSKAYAMTGWRIGYAAGPAELITAMSIIQSQSTSNPNAMAQVAAQSALNGDQACVRSMKEAYQERHQFFWTGLQAIPGIRCLPAQGAFYSFPCVQAFLGTRFPNDWALSDYLLDTGEIATVPGSAFGSPGYLRLSFAVNQVTLQKALTQLKTALSQLSC